MLKVFISYRRKDASFETTVIFESLQRRFGRENVFMDVEDCIRAGDDFRKCLVEAVSGSDVMLVVIGPDWLVDREGRRRLDDPDDFVRIEIEGGLDADNDVRVIPVLVHEADMPGPDDLPETIRGLAFRHAMRLRAGPDLSTDMDRLISQLERLESAVQTDEEPGPGPTDELPVITNSVGMKMVLLPIGEFPMGSRDSDLNAKDDEKPRHLVRITQPFYLGIHPVTQQQYQRVIGGNPSHFGGDPDRPVDTVSWNDAQEFCRLLSALEEEKEAGRAYRLPTEAEWEYACRASGEGQYCFGDSADGLDRHAWFSVNSSATTQPVGQKKPNAWGLCDVHGNVWEWCADVYGPDYYAQSPRDDPPGPSPATDSQRARPRVLRGGAWSSWPPYLRCACRRPSAPGDREQNYGFRVAATGPSPP